MRILAIIVFSFTSVFFHSCDSNTKSTNDTASEVTEIIIPKNDIEFPKLSAEAMDKITSWQYFQEFENDLRQINRGNVRNYRNETERMSAVTDSLLKNIPEALNTTTISSRMRVVNVRIKLLEETIHQPNADINVITGHLNEANEAFSNLIIQINERFEKLQIDQLAKTKENIDRSQKTNSKDSLD